jgi:hypothetical protein
MSNKLEIDNLWLERIKRNLTGIEFGTVQIIVHDGRIVQIERTEKSRFDLEPASETVRRKAGTRSKV